MYSWDNAQVVLVGNKMDLEDERVIVTDRGKRLAEELGTPYITATLYRIDVYLLYIFFMSIYIGVIFQSP